MAVLSVAPVPELPSPAVGSLTDDDALMQCCDPEAFSQLVARNRLWLQRWLSRLGASKDDLDDLAQDIFLKVFLHSHTYQPASFRAWLGKVARRTFLSFRERRTNRIRGRGGDAKQQTAPQATPLKSELAEVAKERAAVEEQRRDLVRRSPCSTARIAPSRKSSSRPARSRSTRSPSCGRWPRHRAGRFQW